MLALKQIPDSFLLPSKQERLKRLIHMDMCRNATRKVARQLPPELRVEANQTCSLNMPTLNINYRIQT